MIAYHGTTVCGIRVLKPFANPASNLDYPCVYFPSIRRSPLFISGDILLNG